MSSDDDDESVQHVPIPPPAIVRRPLIEQSRNKNARLLAARQRLIALTANPSPLLPAMGPFTAAARNRLQSNHKRKATFIAASPFTRAIERSKSKTVPLTPAKPRQMVDLNVVPTPRLLRSVRQPQSSIPAVATRTRAKTSHPSAEATSSDDLIALPSRPATRATHHRLPSKPTSINARIDARLMASLPSPSTHPFDGGIAPLLSACDQAIPYSFASFVERAHRMVDLPGVSTGHEIEDRSYWSKLGEATYSEVFSVARSPDAPPEDGIVIKVIPMRRQSPLRSSKDPMPTEVPQESEWEDVWREVQLTRLLAMRENGGDGFVGLIR